MDFDIKRKIEERKFGSTSQGISNISSWGREQVKRKSSDSSNLSNEEDNENESEGTRFVGADTNNDTDETGITPSLNKTSLIDENFPASQRVGEKREDATDKAHSSDLLKMKQKILQKRLWLSINPVKKSDEFAEMLKDLDLFYKNLRKRKPLRKSGSEKGPVIPERITIPENSPQNSISDVMVTRGKKQKKADSSPPLPPGVNKEPKSWMDDAYEKSDKVSNFSGTLQEEPTVKNDKIDTTNKSDASAKSAEPPKDKDTSKEAPDSSKKEDEHKKAVDDTARDSRKEEADRLRREKETNRDREEKQKMEKVAGLTNEIKEINSGISRLESQINDLEGSLKEMELENRDNPDFDPEPYRDEIEDKKIQIEMMQMKKDLKKMEIESLMGKPVDNDSYEENAVDTTMAKGEIHRERFDEAEYKSKETLKHNLEFLEDYNGDKEGADVVSRFTVDGKETGASQKSSDLQTLIESRFDVKLDPVEMKNR